MVGALGIHMHISIADDAVRTKGRHLLAGCIIYTTAEIALADLHDLAFMRTIDEQTG